MVCAEMEDRDVPQNPKVWLQGRGVEAENCRAASEPAGRALHPQLANLLDDHDESLSARCSAGTGVHQAGTTSAGRAGERQIYRPAHQDTLRLSHQRCAAWRLPRQSERSSTRQHGDVERIVPSYGYRTGGHHRCSTCGELKATTDASDIPAP